MILKTVATVAALVGPLPAFSGSAEILNATASQSGGAWTFDVTIRHDDTGWEHYADAWTVNTPDGRELGRRNLAHPHENEQPFTRSLSGINVPADMAEVVIRAHDSVHGWSETTFTLPLK